MSMFIGIDLSMTATGIAVWEEDAFRYATVKTAPDDKTPAGFLRRAHGIAASILNIVDPKEGDVIAIEAPAFAARSSSLDRLFGLWWLVVDDLIQHHGAHAVHIVAPTVVKKLATGAGNAGKDAVLIETVKRFPDCAPRNNDEADAAWLAVAASYITGSPIIRLPQTHVSDTLAKEGHQ